MTARAGLCYSLAYRYLRAHPDAVLVHGSTRGGDIAHHAWVEDGERVYEPTLDETFPAAEHARAFAPIARARYDAEHAMIWMLRSGHMGPWEYLHGTS